MSAPLPKPALEHLLKGPLDEEWTPEAERGWLEYELGSLIDDYAGKYGQPALVGQLAKAGSRHGIRVVAGPHHETKR